MSVWVKFGPNNELSGKLPKVPGAGAARIPSLSFELAVIAPVVGLGDVVMVNSVGLMKNTPTGGL